jgi:hypothetical protein
MWSAESLFKTPGSQEVDILSGASSYFHAAVQPVCDYICRDAETRVKKESLAAHWVGNLRFRPWGSEQAPIRSFDVGVPRLFEEDRLVYMIRNVPPPTPRKQK